MSFSYSPLDGHQFRILELLPSMDDPTSRGRLHTATPEHSQPYEALSYCWGTQIEKEVMYIDNGELEITKSLASALKYLRLETHSRLIWVDQICINQEDTQEKSNQVQNLMGQIYANTSRLLIWLGEADDTSTLAISAVERACKEIESHGGVSTFHKANLSLLKMRDSNGKIELAPWIAIRKLLRRPWFTRAWVRIVIDSAEEL